MRGVLSTIWSSGSFKLINVNEVSTDKTATTYLFYKSSVSVSNLKFTLVGSHFLLWDNVVDGHGQGKEGW